MSILETEIFHAIQHSLYKRLKLYIRHNYNLNVTSKDGRNGLFYALDIADPSKRSRMLKYCLDHGVDPMQRDNINGFTVLQEAMARGQYDTFLFLFDELAGEIDWSALDARGRTLLHHAVELNNVVIVDKLVSHMSHFRISVDVLDENGLTPYLLAIKLHLPEIVQILLKKGHASQLKCDLKMHHNAREWEEIGTKESRSTLRKKLQHDIHDAMKKGQINKVNKLKKHYSSMNTLPYHDNSMRRYSNFTSTSGSCLNSRSSLSLAGMMDRLPFGEVPETYIGSLKAEKTFHLESLGSTTLPPISNLSRYRSMPNSNSIVDLFQIAPLSS